MRCNNCGSENMTATIQSTTSYKQGHGCLWTILFGLFYWTWLIIKWTFKYLIVFLWYICVEWWRAIIVAISSKPYSRPQFIINLLRRRGKAYTDHQTMFICNNCGNRQKA